MVLFPQSNPATVLVCPSSYYPVSTWFSTTVDGANGVRIVLKVILKRKKKLPVIFPLKTNISYRKRKLFFEDSEELNYTLQYRVQYCTYNVLYCIANNVSFFWSGHLD